MELEFVPAATAAQGFTSSTFSFNLPPLPGAARAENEALAQRFVDLLAEHRELFKPCVSFGQDNGLVYATVPATSTQVRSFVFGVGFLFFLFMQGAIRAEDKEKQAQGGVQLTRLSFPPSLDVPAANAVILDSLKKLYQRS